MKRLSILLLLVSLVACASTEQPAADDVVADFIVVSALQQHDKIRTLPQWSYDALDDRYAILDSGREVYLVEFRRRCRELDDARVTADVRHQRNVLRARFDTLRGCVIEHMYGIDDAAAEELRQLVDAND